MKPGSTFIQEIQPQIETKVAEVMESITDAGTNSVWLVGSSNIAFSFMMGYSMQVFWGMIRSIQLIVLLALTSNQKPPHVQFFMNACLSIA